ncbi:hypothetical protein ACFYS8_13330 [Kitasatospora sp. NPDC004615]|uniref:hypothetical protein n=1 Tax=unclassified Kitasatospora TaxID=2633591 RepID=UPI00369D09D4
MGIHTSAYLAYGAPITGVRYGDDLNAPLATYNATVTYPDPHRDRVGHLAAGSYDNDKLYLVTYCANADLDDPERLTVDDLNPLHPPHWDRHLHAAAKACGVHLMSAPGWLLIAAQS